MADETYIVPSNPTYNTAIRKIQDTDPVKASTIINPVLEQMIENTAALKKQADELAENSAGSRSQIHYENDENIVVVDGIESYQDMVGDIYAISKNKNAVGLVREPNVDVVPTGAVQDCAFSSDSVYLAVAHTNAPFLSIYKRIDGELRKLEDPDILPPSNGRFCSFSTDDKYLAVGCNDAPYLMIYEKDGDTFTKIDTPDFGLTSTVFCGAFSPDGKYLVAGSSTYSNGLKIIRIKNGSFNLHQGLTSGNNNMALCFSNDSKYLIMQHNGGYIDFYAWKVNSYEEFIRLPNPPNRDTSTAGGCVFTSDDRYLYLTGSCNYVIYEKVGDTFVLVDQLAGTSSGHGIFLTDDDKFCYVLRYGSPYLCIYENNDGVITRVSNPSSLPNSWVNGGALSPDGSTFAIGYNASPYLIVYHNEKAFRNEININGMGQKEVTVHEGESLKEEKPFLVSYNEKDDCFDLVTPAYDEIISDIKGETADIREEIESLHKYPDALEVYDSNPDGIYELENLESYDRLSDKVIAITQNGFSNLYSYPTRDSLPMAQGANYYGRYTNDTVLADDGNEYYAWVYTGILRLYKRTDRKEFQLIPTEYTAGRATYNGDLTFSKNGRLLAVSHPNTPRLVVLKRENEQFAIKQQLSNTELPGSVDALAFSNKGKYFVLGFTSGDYLKFYKVNEESDDDILTEIETGIQLPNRVLGLTFSPNDDMLVVTTTSQYAALIYWIKEDVDGVVTLTEFTSDNLAVTDVLNSSTDKYGAAFSPDGKWLLLGGCRPLKRVGDDFEVFGTIALGKGMVRFNHTGELLLLGLFSGTGTLIAYTFEEGVFKQILRHSGWSGGDGGYNVTCPCFLANSDIICTLPVSNLRPLLLALQIDKQIDINGFGKKTLEIPEHAEFDGKSSVLIQYTVNKDAFTVLNPQYQYELYDGVDRSRVDIVATANSVKTAYDHADNAYRRANAAYDIAENAAAISASSRVYQESSKNIVEIDGIQSYEEMAGRVFAVTLNDQDVRSLSEAVVCDSVTTSEVYGISFSADGEYLAITNGGTTKPYLATYKKNGTLYEKLPDPDVMPGTAASGCALSKDGSYLAVRESTQGVLLRIYKLDGDRYVKLNDPDVMPTGGTRCCFSPDGRHLITTNSSTTDPEAPSFIIYKREGDIFTKLPDPDELPVNTSWGISFSANGVYMSVSCTASPGIAIYKRDGDTYTKLADPDVSESSAYPCAFSPDGVYLANSGFRSSGGYRLTVYKRNGDTFTALPNANFSYRPTNTVQGLAFSPDGRLLAMGLFENSGIRPDTYLKVYRRNGDMFSLVGATALRTSVIRTCTFSPDGKHILVGGTFGAYEVEREEIEVINVNDLGERKLLLPEGGYVEPEIPFLTVYNKNKDGFNVVTPIY